MACAGGKCGSCECESCPPATQDPSLNGFNREQAIHHFMYGPAAPQDPSSRATRGFWHAYSQALSRKLGRSLSPLEASERRCGSCAAFDISPSMLRCLGGAHQEPAGTVGYCHSHSFACSSLRTCLTWSPGGPIR